VSQTSNFAVDLNSTLSHL